MVCFSMFPDKEPIDGECGSQRCMQGVHSYNATTTMMVVDRPGITEDGLQSLVAQHNARFLWAKRFSALELHMIAWFATDELIRIAHAFEVGDVVERRGDMLMTRFPAEFTRQPFLGQPLPDNLNDFIRSARMNSKADWLAMAQAVDEYLVSQAQTA